MIEHQHPQGSEGWLEARRGVITASRAKDARSFKKSGESSSERLAYAMDTARERCPGGRAAPVFQNAAMRMGSEEEQFAAIEYMARTGCELTEAYFITTPDRKFGASLDRWVGRNRKAAIEVKTMVSSAVLFKALVDGDISEYRDQCVFSMWLLVLDWIDLCLWCPDLQILHVVRIHRDEAEIQRMEDDMLAFDKLVTQYETKLRAKLDPRQWCDEGADTFPPEPVETADPGAPDAAMDAPWALPATPIDRPALAPADF